MAVLTAHGTDEVGGRQSRVILSVHKIIIYVLLLLLFLGHHLCDEPRHLENGYRIGNEFWEGKNVTYKCNKGYRLRGPLVRVCNETGNWTMEEPTCEGELHLLQPVDCRMVSFLS